MPLNLLYTRRMEDIEVGGKVTGKVGPASLAALYVRSTTFRATSTGGACRQLREELRPRRATTARSSTAGPLRERHAGAFWATRERGDGSSSWVRSRRILAAGQRASERHRGEGLRLGRRQDNAFALEWPTAAPTRTARVRFPTWERISPGDGFIEADQRGTYGARTSLEAFSTDAAGSRSTSSAAGRAV